MTETIYKTFPNNPPHLFSAGASYMITAATYQKYPHMQHDERKQHLLDSFEFLLARDGWTLIACVVMSNHYHALISSPATGAQQLSSLIASLHKFTARRWNEADAMPGRAVWWNYWDTCLTNETSYYARVNYIHWNPVRHKVAASPELYPFSTYPLWQQRFRDELSRIEREYPFDHVSVHDDF